jgi:predicted glycogen debranching enzyme
MAHITTTPVGDRNFFYVEEARRGLDCVEDLASPGVFEWEISNGAAVLIFSAKRTNDHPVEQPFQCYALLADQEKQRRNRFSTTLQLAADAYIVTRGENKTIIAGYPWFGDWGRDTFIALRGLCIANGRLSDAHDILLQWSSTVSEGMLPNRFPDHGEAPEYNSVDASLWYRHTFVATKAVYGSVTGVIIKEQFGLVDRGFCRGLAPH